MYCQTLLIEFMCLLRIKLIKHLTSWISPSIVFGFESNYPSLILFNYHAQEIFKTFYKWLEKVNILTCG